MGHSKGGHFCHFLGCVCKKWPSWGGGTFSNFYVCGGPPQVAHLGKKGGGHFFWISCSFFFLFYSARGTWLSRFCLGSQVLLFIICTYIVAVAFLKKIDSLKVNRMLALINLNRHLLKVFSKISTVGTVSFFTRVLCILKNVITKK